MFNLSLDLLILNLNGLFKILWNLLKKLAESVVFCMETF